MWSRGPDLGGAGETLGPWTDRQVGKGLGEEAVGSLFGQMASVWSAAPTEIPTPGQSLRAWAGGVGGWSGQSAKTPDWPRPCKV